MKKFTRPELMLMIAGSLALLAGFLIYAVFHPDAHLKLPLSQAEIEQRAVGVLADYAVTDSEPAVIAALERAQPYARKYVQNYGKAALIQQLQDPEKRERFYSWDVAHQQTGTELSMSLNGDLKSFEADSVLISENEVLPFNTGRYEESIERFHQELAQPILASSYWKNARKDSSKHLATAEGGEQVLLYYTAGDAGLRYAVETRFTNSGKLISLTYSQNEELPTRSVAETGFNSARIVLGVLFALLIGVIFFNRLFNRLIDVRLIKFDGAFIGLLALSGFLLNTYSSYSDGALESSAEFWTSILLLPLMVVSFISAAAFVVMGTADSLSQEAWPAKKRAIALLRHGLIRNAIVGGGLLRGASAGLLMFGISALLFFLVDTSWQASDDISVYLADTSAFALYDRLSTDLLFSLFFVFVFVVVPASYFKVKQLNTWLIFALVLLPAAMFTSRLPETGHEFVDALFSLLVFSIPVWMYLKYDALSALISVFLYSITTSGAAALSAPAWNDGYILLAWLLINVVLLVVAYTGVQRSDAISEIPDLVPDYIKRLAKEQRIEQEFVLAKEVQEHFLISATASIRGYDVAASCKTAYEVGGDYYDFISLDAHRTLVVIADVSGKGVKAAFYMTLLKGYLQSVSEHHTSVADIIKTVNRLFYENHTRGTFITVLAGILDVKAHSFEFVRAGHDPLLLIGPDGSSQTFTPRGYALGMAKPDIFDAFLEVRRIVLKPHHSIILFTDGYPESRSMARKQLGEAGLRRIIQQNSAANNSAKSLLEAIHEDVLSFVGRANQHDDMTILVLRRQP